MTSPDENGKIAADLKAGKARGRFAVPRVMNKKSRYAIILRAILATLIICVGSSAVAAATFRINSATQDVDAHPGDGACATVSGICTFQAAIQEHNALGGTNTIILPADTYVLAFYPRAVSGGVLAIQGEEASTTILDGGGGGRVFEIYSGSVSLEGVTIRNGGQGGLSISESASLSLNRCIIKDNSAIVGGGIWNLGSLWITNSTISHNSAELGGGIANSGALILSKGVVSNNNAERGGGIVNAVAVTDKGMLTGNATLTNVTVSGNSATDEGGGLLNAGLEWLENVRHAQLSLRNTTISNNDAMVGGGIHNSLGVITVVNSIMANSFQGGNCSGPATISSEGHNLSSDTTCNLNMPTDRSGLDPQLGLLADNGGPTFSHALLATSPAIDTADPSNSAATDQRGIARPQGKGPDIGAYELEQLHSVPSLQEWGFIVFALLAGFESARRLIRQGSKLLLVFFVLIQMTSTASAKNADARIAKAHNESDLIVHRSDDFHYEIKYPKDWKAHKDYVRQNPRIGLRDFFWIGGMSVKVWDTTSYSYEELAVPPPGGIDPDSIRDRPIMIDGHQGKMISYVAVGDNNSGSTTVMEIFIPRGNFVYVIECSQDCDRIISSFRFLSTD